MVCNELSLEPLRAAVTAMCPDIDATCKERNAMLKGNNTQHESLLLTLYVCRF